MTRGGVKALKQRLRTKDPALYEKGPVKEKAELTSTSTSTKRMTFWLPGDIIGQIKAKAKREKRTASDILREILGEILK